MGWNKLLGGDSVSRRALFALLWEAAREHRLPAAGVQVDGPVSLQFFDCNLLISRVSLIFLKRIEMGGRLGHELSMVDSLWSSLIGPTKLG